MHIARAAQAFTCFKFLNTSACLLFCPPVRHFILGAMSGTFKLLLALPKWLADRLITAKCMWTKPLKPLQL